MKEIFAESELGETATPYHREIERVSTEDVHKTVAKLYPKKLVSYTGKRKFKGLGEIQFTNVLPQDDKTAIQMGQHMHDLSIKIDETKALCIQEARKRYRNRKRRRREKEGH